MKKIFLILPCLLMLLTGCDWFELDNLDGYDAKIHGQFVDSKTGEMVPGEYFSKKVSGSFTWNGVTYTYDYTIENTGYLSAYEYGWNTAKGTEQKWVCKNVGSYRNDLVFAGDYRLEATHGPFYPVTKDNLSLKPGDNKVDFDVTPYCRILDPVLSYDKANQKINATFKLECGDTSKANIISKAILCCFTDKYVGANFNNCGNDIGSYKVATDGIPSDGNTEVSLSIDMAKEANATEFKYTRPHYLRIGACCQSGVIKMSFDWTTWTMKKSFVSDGKNNADGLFNFSKLYVLDPEAGTITETDWGTNDD